MSLRRALIWPQMLVDIPKGDEAIFTMKNTCTVI
jgi:hypothetical protein